MSSNPYPLRAVTHQMLHQSVEGQYLKLELECGHEQLRHVSDKTFEEPSKLKIPKRARCTHCEKRANYGSGIGKNHPKKADHDSIFERGRKRLRSWWRRVVG